MAINPWRGLQGLPASVWVLCGATLINRAGTMALPFLTLYLTSRLGVPPSRAGLGLAVYGAGTLITAPLSGRLCDVIGPARVMAISLFTSGALILALPAVSSFPAVLALVFVWSIAGEAFRPAALAIISDLVTPDQRKPAFALGRLAVNLGLSVGPAAGGFLAMVSFPAIFLVDGATSLLAGVVVAVARWPAHERGAAAAPGHAGAGGRAWLPDPRYLYFLVATLPVMIVFFQNLGAMPIHIVRHLGMPESSFGLLISINTVLIILIEVPIVSAMAHWQHRWSLALGSLLVGAGFGGMALATGFPGVAFTVIVWTFGEILLMPASAACAADLAPEGRRGEYMGLFSMVFGLAFAIGPWLGTSLLDAFGPAALWSGAFLVGCLSAVMLLRVNPAPPAGLPVDPGSVRSD